MKVAIVKYNAGNVCSVENALKRLGIEPFITDKLDELQTADRVIFPGVGEASTAMQYLREKGLDQVIKHLHQPVLGVCLGMQLLGEMSEENETVGLGIMPFRIKKFESKTQKVPHTGWNQIGKLNSKLFHEVAENSFVYFVHSYFAEINPVTIAETDYIKNFSAAVEHKNFYAVQFHTEKSGKVGEKILENFLKL
ncbi:MAG: imidazole glycerol phosphate synthase subunit HisH [Pyrinomonadaceae bacterium]